MDVLEEAKILIEKWLRHGENRLKMYRQIAVDLLLGDRFVKARVVYGEEEGVAFAWYWYRRKVTGRKSS